MIHVKNILHPTDFSEDSQYALEFAGALARDQGARVILLHVVPRPVPVGHDSRVPAFKDAHTDEDLQTYQQGATARLQKLCDQAPCAGVQALLREGDAADVIVRTAEETACDLIVMGSHGKSQAYQAMMGSVAAEVTRHAPCPVLTVRIPPSTPAGSVAAGMEAAGGTY
jgi:nucleotide-binding universal stress UspA family protein